MMSNLELVPRAKCLVASAAILGGLLLLDGQLGPVTFRSCRSCAAAILTVALLAVVRPKGRWVSCSIAFAGVVATFLLPTVPLALLAYVFTVAMIQVHSSPEDQQLVFGLPQATLSYVGIGWLPTLIPQLRIVSDMFTLLLHRYLNATTGVDHYLSPTAVGGPIFFAAIFCLVWRWRLAGSWLRLCLAIGVTIMWIAILPWVVLPASVGSQVSFARGTSYGFTSLFVTLLLDALAQRGTSLAIRPTQQWSRMRLGIAGAATLLVGITLTGIVIPQVPANRNVLVHNRGGLDWERPVWGKFGAFSGGMFGLFPVYARANGHQINVLDRDALTPDDLRGVQTLMLINSPKEWAGDELQTVRDFVANGGSLLVLGDHTDVFGLMKGFNTLLVGFGIEFLFDSAYHAHHTWSGCTATAPDALSGEWDLEYPGIAVGASLKLTGSARPLLTGRYAHSDHGVRENTIGAFLGNYSYEAGEKLGDNVLIATATHGRGRVIVFGDTSPYQGSSSYTLPHTIGPIFDCMSRPITLLDRPEFRVATAIVFCVILLLVYLSRANTVSTAALTLSLLAGVAGGWIECRTNWDYTIHIDSDCFVIDQSHLPATGHYEAKVNPSGSIQTCLSRFGLRIVSSDQWEPDNFSKARGLAFIAPQKAFSASEVQDLLRFEESGGVVILAVGQPDAAASQLLLRNHELNLVSRPLGTVPSSGKPDAKDRPRFFDAWPIVSRTEQELSERNDVDVLYRSQKDVCALFCHHGQGGLMLFADTRYFSSMNIEDTWGHWEGNLAFIHDAFRKYLKLDANAVQPVFRSPDKPN